MRDSIPINWIIRGGNILIILVLCGFMGTQYFNSKKSTESSYSVVDSVDMALNTAEKGDLEQTSVLMRQAIHRAGTNPDTFEYLWDTTQKIVKQFEKNKLFVSGLSRDLLTGLNSAIHHSNSVNDFDRLYRLRLTIMAEIPSLEVNALPIKSTTSFGGLFPFMQSGLKSVFAEIPPGGLDPFPKQNGMNLSNFVDLMREGLKSLKDGDEDRAEFLIQTAIQGQAKFPLLAPDLWKEYKGFLNSNPKLEPHDKIARLSIYLTSLEECLEACLNTKDFQVVWEVRNDLLKEKSGSHDALVKDVLFKIDTLKDNIRNPAISKGTSELFPLIAFQSDKLKKLAAICFATAAPNSKETDKVAKSISEMLNEALVLTKKDVETIKGRKNSVENIIKKDESVIDPASSKDKMGLLEKINRDTQELASAIETAEFPSWIQMANLIVSKTDSQKNEPKISQSENLLDDSYSKIIFSLNQVQGETVRLQGICYNLWALRAIYGAESSQNWDAELGQIDLGLLHPTVNALYSITYDALIRKHKDPQIRTRMVQNILNSKKVTLSEF